MNVTQILKNWLSTNKYDGLCNPDNECGCGLDDFCPCGYISEDCRPAHKRIATESDVEEFDGVSPGDFIYSQDAPAGKEKEE